MTGVTIWTGVLPAAEARWLAGGTGPLTGSDCRGSIGASDTGTIWIDHIALAWLSRLDPAADGACRRTGDGAAEIQCGGAWCRLTPDDPAGRTAP